jgi:hypothetical protein
MSEVFLIILRVVVSSGFTALKYDKVDSACGSSLTNLPGQLCQVEGPVPGLPLQGFRIFLGSAYIRAYPLRVSTLGADSLDLLKCHIPYSANGKCKTHQPRSMTHWTTFPPPSFWPPLKNLKSNPGMASITPCLALSLQPYVRFPTEMSQPRGVHYYLCPG